MPPQFSPVQNAERIHLLDALRGFAILGIFIANLWGFTWYAMYTPEQKAAMLFGSFDPTMEFLQSMFVEGKFYSIFSMLFGIGFALYLKKGDADKSVLGTFRKRLAILLLIGFVHLLIWSGDIVSFYALLGFALIPFRKLPDKILLIIAGICILSPIARYALMMSNPSIFNWSAPIKNIGLKMDSHLGINSDADYYRVASGKDAWTMLRANVNGIFFRYGTLIFQSREFKVFGMFLVGLVIGRSQFLKKLGHQKKLLWALVIAGIFIGLPANYIMARLSEKKLYEALTPTGLYQTIAYAFGVVPLALAYASAIALIYLQSRGRKILMVIAPAGKMALTNYIGQSLIGTLLFTQLGLGIRGVGPTSWTLLALVIISLQVIISTIWLKYFHYGPLEWLWRSATYNKWQPLRKNSVAIAIPAVP
jgi:uncharacterized protein